MVGEIFDKEHIDCPSNVKTLNGVLIFIVFLCIIIRSRKCTVEEKPSLHFCIVFLNIIVGSKKCSVKENP